VHESDICTARRMVRHPPVAVKREHIGTYPYPQPSSSREALTDTFRPELQVYGTLNEYGYGIQLDKILDGDVPECNATTRNSSEAYAHKLVCGANRLLSDRFPHAVVYDATRPGNQPIYGAWTSVIVDVGDVDYQKFMLENTKRVVDTLDSNAGICIDRGDWLGVLNAAGDDTVSMVHGRVARSLMSSWKETIPKMAEILHESGKVL
jgi:hypothetical protein